MSCNTVITPFLYIECDTVQQTDELETALQHMCDLVSEFDDDDDDEVSSPVRNFDFLRGGPVNSIRIQILLLDDECESFDNDIVQLNQWLLNLYKLQVQGYWIAETDGTRSRGELNTEGGVRYADVDWLMHYPCDQIDALREFAARYELIARPKSSRKCYTYNSGRITEITCDQG